MSSSKPETAKDKERRYRKLFESFDSERSGRINFKEFENFLQHTNNPLKSSLYAKNQIFQSIDGNNDNHIDFQDFCKYLLSAESQILQGFQTLDVDQDGCLDKQDIKQYLINNLNIDPAPDDVDTFFRKMDSKKDGVITFDEFKDFLLFMPRLHGSRMKTAFHLYNDDLENLNSEGDITVGQNDFLKSVGFFLAGGLSGVVSRTCTAPFDRIKVFLIARADLTSTILHTRDQIKTTVFQSTHHEIKSFSRIRSPIIKAATTLYKQGGLRSFYVGNGLNVLKVFPESAMKFGSFEAAKRFFCSLEGVNDPANLSRLSTYMAGGFGGVVAQMSVYPIDTLKYRLQCANLDSKVRGNRLLFQTAKDMYKEGGVRIFYRGLYVGLGGMFPYAALDLGTFATIKKWYIRRAAHLEGCSLDEAKVPNYVVLSMGALSGTFGASMVYPINLLRTRLQAQGTYAHPYTYDGFLDVARKTIAREGVHGLFKGLVPNLAKVAPAVSISYLMYENLKTLFGLETL